MKSNRSSIISFLFVLIICNLNSHAQSWSPFITPTSAPVKDLAVYNGKLIIGHWGAFSGNYIETFDGNTFDTIGILSPNTGSQYIMAMETFNNDLYVGGVFDSINGVAANCLARWDGTTWHPVFNGPPYSNFNDVEVLKVFNGELYVGGFFSLIDSVPYKNIAKWNGAQWSSVGAGFNCGVTALNSYQNNLYAGGCFFLSGIDTIYRIAKWDGTLWQPLNKGIDPNNTSNGFVFSLQEYNGELYAGGDFNYADSIYSPEIAKWNGASWTNPGFSLLAWVTQRSTTCSTTASTEAKCR